MGLALFSAAQTTPLAYSAAEKQDVVTLDRLVVTGSSFSLPADAAPLTIITQETIERGGVATNLLEVLRKQIPALSGSGNLGLSNASTNVAATYGGSRVALHNTSTLVLLNGRRLATNGSNGRGGSSFVDVSQIPLSAIERVEVLTDGASAIYGSDAIGGVVNVILKPAYNGSEVGGRYAFSTRDGDYSERSAYFVSGMKKGRLGAIVTGEYSKSTPLYQDERPFSSEARSQTFSGVVGSGSTAYYLNPAINSPRERVSTGSAATATSLNALVSAGVYIAASSIADPATASESSINLAPDVTLYASHEQFSTYTGTTYKLIDQRLEAFANILYTRATASTQLPAQSTTMTVPAGSPYDPLISTAGNISTVAFRYQPLPRKYIVKSNDITITGGLKGELSPEWNWETAYTKSRDLLKAQTTNVIYTPNLTLAVAGGYDANGNAVAGGAYSRVYSGFSDTSSFVIQPALDPFARSQAVDPASLANLFGTARADLKSELDSFDFVLRGKFECLPAGSAELAIGGNYRDEKLSGMPDDNSRYSGPTAQRWSGATIFDPLAQSRYIRSGFAELHLPVTSPKQEVFLAHALDLSLAFRMEDYNESGVSRVPKYGVRWQPLNEELTIRGTYGKGFSAPTLFQMYGPPTQGSSASLSTVLGYTSGTRQGTLRTTSNPNLKPTTSRSQSVGFVYLPKMVRGLRVSVDYLDLKLTGLIGTVGALTIVQNVNQLGTASPYADLVTLNGAPITTVGQIRAFLDAGGSASQILITDQRRNYTGAVVRTVDTSVDYALPLLALGQFEVGTTGTFFLDDKIQANPTEPYYEYAGLATSAEGTMPGYRFYSHLTWSKGPWQINLGQTYIPAVDDLGTGGSTFATSTTLKRIRVGSFTSWDVGAGYELTLGNAHIYSPQKVTLRVGINNVADHLPPSATQAFPTTSAAGADVATYGAIGRLYYVSADLKF